MSADNWTYCPRCKNKAEEDLLLLQQKAADAYGKVPPAQYLQLLELAEKPPQISQTLREDYELGTFDGVFQVDYRCSCDCGFTFKFTHSENLDTVP